MSANILPFVKEVATCLDDEFKDQIAAALIMRDNGRDNKDSLALTIQTGEKFQIEFPDDNVKQLRLSWRFRKVSELTEEEKGPADRLAHWKNYDDFTRITKSITIDELIALLRNPQDLESVSTTVLTGEYDIGLDFFG